MRTRTWVAATVIALVGLTGCATETGSVAEDAPQGSNANTEQDGDGNGDAEAEPNEPEEMPTFGDTYTWDNGLSVKIAKPQEFQPGEFAAADDAPNYRSFEVTIVNNTGDQVDLAGAFTSVQSGDEEMSEVFDTEQGFDGSPSTVLLDGRQSRYKIGFGIAKPRDIVLQFDPGQYDPVTLEPVVFTSTQ